MGKRLQSAGMRADVFRVNPHTAAGLRAEKAAEERVSLTKAKRKNGGHIIN